MLTADEILASFDVLPAFGRRARELRGRTVRIVARGALGPELPALGRDEATVPAPAAPPSLEPGDTWIAPVVPTPEGRRRFAEDLARLAAAFDGIEDAAFAPVPASTSGACALWAVAAARLVLPGPVRIAARFDALGTHVAQIALSFGADTLEGPVTAERALPLAGVFRPTETSRPALEALVRSAGASPLEADP